MRTGPGWLSQAHADVPAGDAWLGRREREAQQALSVERRRADWRLGRWTGKAALAAWLGRPPAELEILAAADGAPEAWRGDARLPVSVSLSHRDGVAVAAVAGAPAIVGCDLELVEPRSDAFLREWLSDRERADVVAAADRALAANLLWTGKEAAAKVLREGLRLDVRQARVAAAPDHGAWAPVAVTLEKRTLRGWWRRHGAHVLTVLTDPPAPAPVALDR